MIAKDVKVIDTREIPSVVISLRADGIMHLHIRTKEELSLEDLKESHKLHLLLCKGKSYPNLVTFEEAYIPFSKGAREFAASEEANKYTVCDAMVITSTAMRLAINFYLKFNKPVWPTCAFTDKERAIEWIKTFL